MSSDRSAADDPAGRSGTRWLLALGVVALLMLVALSVRAHYSVGPSGVPNQGPGAALLGSIVQLLLVVCVAAFELLLVLALVYAPWRRLREAGSGGSPVPRVSRVAMLRIIAIPVAVLAAEVVAFALLVKRRTGGRSGSTNGLLRVTKGGHHQVPSVGAVTVTEATVLAAALGLVALAVILVVRFRSRHARAAAMAAAPDLPQDLTSAIDQSLAELAAGADPRQAVITAYERMERVLAGIGLPALSFETPLEYLERALARLEASRGALVRLTDLFETARFSTHEVGSVMRSEAEQALGKLRAELAG
ncbi:MAG TPA: DUF4129 domain-containing protein [Candidatus Dormibacteraeota bacterium]|nr:DUF4129 domain-containing protein [Candidatus Dormibacteraeota bacterium]